MIDDTLDIRPHQLVLIWCPTLFSHENLTYLHDDVHTSNSDMTLSGLISFISNTMDNNWEDTLGSIVYQFQFKRKWLKKKKLMPLKIK